MFHRGDEDGWSCPAEEETERGLRTASGPQPQKRAADGVARHGDASHPQARSRQERRGGKEKSAHGVQVGIPPHTVSFNDREDETAFAYAQQIC